MKKYWQKNVSHHFNQKNRVFRGKLGQDVRWSKSCVINRQKKYWHIFPERFMSDSSTEDPKRSSNNSHSVLQVFLWVRVRQGGQISPPKCMIFQFSRLLAHFWVLKTTYCNISKCSQSQEKWIKNYNRKSSSLSKRLVILGPLGTNLLVGPQTMT